MKRLTTIPVLIALVLLAGCATNQMAWKASVDQTAKTRFIPVELWSGSRWQGEQSIQLTPADFTFGRRSHKTIKGPFQWTHPKTGEAIWVYERLNRTTKGNKRQLFTVNPDGTGLAKVFDERPGEPTRYFSTNAVLFPLGRWGVGEKRTFTFDEYIEDKVFKRTAMIYMRRLSFTYKKVDHAMKYDWIQWDDQETMLYHERFIYGPRESLMYFKNRMKD
jgi:hypothetical protein